MNKFKLEIQVSIRPEGGSYSQGLQIQESVILGVRDFGEMCKVLAQFHDLALKLEATK